MDNTKLLTMLVSVTLILTVLNLSATINIYNSINNNNINTQTTPAKTPFPSIVRASPDDDPVQGLKDAPVTIIEFSDFQCPYCAKFYFQTLPQIRENYINTGKVKLVYRDFPLSFHQYAQKAAEAAECAQEQGKFWEFHDKIYENQSALNNDNLKQYAKDLGLDIKEFNTCLDSGKMSQEVMKDFQDGSSYGVTGTPAFFINGKKLVGAQPYEAFQRIIEQELNSSK
ncbi:Thioredoxin [uncultured archaeon]|nr:Thioredoxin [uncultured archaeon]